MSDKDEFDGEIEQELEKSLEVKRASEEDDDFTVRVHREEYTVRRRFYDKDKALETADLLRMDKGNVVEDNIEQEFIALNEDDEEVDWDKLVDAGLNFFPPISDAAEKKIEDTSTVAAELEAESSLVKSNLDKTLTMSSMENLKVLKAKQDEVSSDNEVAKESAIVVDETDIDDEDLGDLDIETEEPDVVEENLALSEKRGEVKKGFPVKIAIALFVVVAAVGGYFFLYNPSKAIKTVPVKQNAVVAQKRVEKVQKPITVEPAGPVAVKQPKAVNDKVMPPKPVEHRKVELPKVTKFHPYTIHISSYKSKAKADSEVLRIRKKGYVTFAVLITVPGKGEWHRVYTGYYENYTKAKAALKELKTQLREDAVVGKTFFGIQLGSIAKKSGLTSIEKRLSAKGYSGYYIPLDSDTEYLRLMVGAYKEEASAIVLFDRLKKDGFDAKVVKR